MSRALLVAQTSLWLGGAFAQCGSTISAFPYLESFEAGAAWTSGGTGDDWAWGTPAHPNINSAGGGTKAWCVGGLTGAFYTFGEQSWLESPCFDFSTLQFPVVSFKIFWECERTYDGMGFQYSLDQGGSWTNVGSYGAPPDCVDTNWFNTGNILNLNLSAPKAGWSGRVGPTSGSCSGGSGSNGWVTASHCIADLAGEPSVKFRFVFGAGTTCNNFDGIAVDEVFIGEAPPEEASFSFECFGDSVAVHDIVSCAQTWFWNFGDPASGASNTSTLASVDHGFSSPGSYNITLTLNYSCRPQRVLTTTLNILDLELQSTDPTCAGNDGTATAVVSGAAGTIVYDWSPDGQTTAAITGLGAGTYIVNVSDGGVCPASGSVSLAAPSQAPQLSVSSQDVSCFGGNNGSASVNVISALPGYEIAWSPQGGSGTSTSGLTAGNYSCTVTDVQACSTTIDFSIDEPDELVLTPQQDTTICTGESLTLGVTATGGTPGYTFTWVPLGPDVSPMVNTTYTVSVTDANGCTMSPEQVNVDVGSVATPQFTVVDSLGCSPHCAVFNADAPDGTLTWTFGDGTVIDGDTTIEHCYGNAGVYDVLLTVTSDDGCNGSWTMVEAVDVLASPVAAFTANPPVATREHPTVQFIDGSSDASSWWWSFGDPLDSTSTLRSPSFTYPEVDCYEVRLRVINALGCSDSSQYTLCMEEDFAAYIPNAFTPNDDGYNDVWGVITTVGLPKTFEIDVFDRWGGVLFHSDDKGVFWDGTTSGGPQPIGVYQWRLRMRDSTGNMQERTGHVTIVR